MNRLKFVPKWPLSHLQLILLAVLVTIAMISQINTSFKPGLLFKYTNKSILVNNFYFGPHEYALNVHSSLTLL